MKKILIIFALLLPATAFAGPITVTQGGTSSTTLTGILLGNATSSIQSLIIGSGLTLSGGTLSASGGTVGGSGAANEVSYWSNSSTITGGSNFIYNGTNLAVGTSTPSSKLTVWGNGTGTGTLFNLVNNASTTAFHVLDNGNVGIGTTTPSNRLSISTNGTGVGLTFDSAGTIIANLTRQTVSGTIGFAIDSAVAARPISINNALSADTLIANGGGKVGVGTTSPFARLSIAGISNATTNLFAVATSSATATTTAFRISQNGNVHMSIAGIDIGLGTTPPSNGLITAGNVGVGTSSPSAMLAVQDSFYASGTGFFGGAVTSTSTFTSTATSANTFPYASSTALSATTICLTGDTCRTTWPTGGGGGTGSGNVATSTSETTGYVPFYTSTAGSPATIGANANFFWDTTNSRLGIGTTTPWAQLSVNPNAIGTTPYFAIGSSTATKFLVNNAGNVGIATTSPASLLEVDGGITIDAPATNFGLTLKRASATMGAFLPVTIGGTISPTLQGVSGRPMTVENTSSSGTIFQWSNTAGTVLGLIDPSGRFGLGTSTPAWMFEIATSSVSTTARGGQLGLTDTNAGTNLKHWLFSSMGGNLYIGTTTDAYATSTPAAFSITNGGVVTLSTGATVSGTLSGTTGSIGGGLLTAGTCTSGTVNITGATTAMVADATPVTYPGDGSQWDAYVSSAGVVTVKVCAVVALTPGASTYNVRVLP